MLATLRPVTMKPFLWIVLAGALAGCTESDAGRQSLVASIGQTRVEIPIPPGFTASPAASPAAQRLAAALTAETNRLIALLVPVARATAGAGPAEAPLLERFLLLQTYRDLEGYTLSPSEFAGIAKQFAAGHRRRLEELFASGAAGAADSRALRLTLAPGERLPLGLHTQRLNAAGYAALIGYRYREHGRTRDGLMIAGMNIIRVRGELLYVHVYSRYHGQDDIAWVRALSARWVDAILAANGRASPLSRFIQRIRNLATGLFS